MAGGNPPKPPSSSNKPPPNHHRSNKSRWESSNKSAPNPNNNKAPTPRIRPNHHHQSPSHQSKLPPFPFPDPPPPPSYGFHSLDRRTVVLADGSVRSYFALPIDYQEFVPEFHRPGPRFDRNFPISPEFRPPPGPGPEFAGPPKRKFGDQERDGYERQRMQLLQYGNVDGNGSSNNSRPSKMTRTEAGGGSSNGGGSRNSKHNEVDQGAVKKAFLHYVKLLFENGNQRKKYLANGKQGSLQCIACERSSKYFSDTHSLIMHLYHTDLANKLVDHMALHKALCIVMGWNYNITPDNSKSYQFLPAEEAASSLDDLILWPPTVIIENTITGKGRDGRMEGMGNRTMDNYLRDIGIHGGKPKSLYNKDGHQGITLIKFSNNHSDLMEALRLAEYFERENRGRNSWARVESLNLSKDDDSNPNLVKGDEKTKEKKRILYGYLATVRDLEKFDFDTRKKCDIRSRREAERLK